jgi:hypothetical protein
MARPEPIRARTVVKDGAMPIKGKLYTQKELVDLLEISKQAVSNIAHRQDWDGPQPGLYWAEFVEPYLEGRNIDPLTLPVVDNDHPAGATLAEREKEFRELS